MPKNSHTDSAYKLLMATLFSKALFTKYCSRVSSNRVSPKEASYRAASLTKILLTSGLSLATLYVSPVVLADVLTVTVNNIEKAGEIHVAVYDNAEAFEADRGEKGGAAPGITEGTIEMVEPGSVTYVYELPAGTYAIGIFHDVNLNNKMDNNFFGIPKEQYGFSNNARAFFGPPAFEAAAFELNCATTQSIDL